MKLFGPPGPKLEFGGQLSKFLYPGFHVCSPSNYGHTITGALNTGSCVRSTLFEGVRVHKLVSSCSVAVITFLGHRQYATASRSTTVNS